MTTHHHGNPPYQIVVLHGGPGAVGDAAPLACELSQYYGILEPLQTKTTLSGVMDELEEDLLTSAQFTVTLIGHSWGAMLAYIFAAHHPNLVKKVILISSGSFEARYAESMMATELGRMTEEERRQVDVLTNELERADLSSDNANDLFCQLGKIFSKIDSYDLMISEFEEHSKTVQGNYEAFKGIWPEVAALRASGALLELGAKIQCPVVAFHGDYDSHPAAGVQAPLSRVLKDFRFVMFEKCGHYPWFEKQARWRFMELLREEL